MHPQTEHMFAGSDLEDGALKGDAQIVAARPPDPAQRALGRWPCQRE
jgi:hypothetical protein